jgi:hypothetical protein
VCSSGVHATGLVLRTIFSVKNCLLISVLYFNFIHTVACWLRNVEYDYVSKILRAWRILLGYVTYKDKRMT